MKNYMHASDRLFERPLMLEGIKAQVIADSFSEIILGERTEVQQFEVVPENAPQLGTMGNRLGKAYDHYGIDPLFVHEGVAIIEVEGSLVEKGAFLGKSSGMVSCEGIHTQIEFVKRHQNALKGVVFELDSFGGEIPGIFECATAIWELGQIIPTTAILTSHACSAGYLLASACHAINMPMFGKVGSIGALVIHVDEREKLAKEGKKVTIFRAGERKARLNPFEETLAEDVQDLEHDLAETREHFVATVANYRTNRVTESTLFETEARTYAGKRALDLGLVDFVSDPRKAFEAFVNQVN